MADYIDRQAAIEVLNKLARSNFTLKPGYEYYLGALHDAWQDIKYLPSADVEPVRHGRWEVFYAEELCGYRHAYYVCSSCFGSSDDEFDYCPNCGARMDGEQDDGKGND